MTIQQVAPGFVARQVVACNVCQGKGEVINGEFARIIGGLYMYSN